MLEGGAGDDLLDGGEDQDEADYFNAAVGVRVDLTLTAAQDTGMGRDTLVSIEDLFGSPFNDRLTGNDADNTIDGDEGDDTIAGGAGDDFLTGRTGRDQIAAGDGDDVVSGDDGADAIDGGDGDDFIEGGEDADTSTRRGFDFRGWAARQADRWRPTTTISTRLRRRPARWRRGRRRRRLRRRRFRQRGWADGVPSTSPSRARRHRQGRDTRPHRGPVGGSATTA